jgi:hypothetical protein
MKSSEVLVRQLSVTDERQPFDYHDVKEYMNAMSSLIELVIAEALCGETFWIMSGMKPLEGQANTRHQRGRG